ncbi:hypothetical protein FISHEDRAFT_41664 [Fistulina hepatica ATCC 64428]|nr:hypothetical protein FISHEDRAFT_41664 [Fistulina hepatica ATCC 64428]
MAQPLPRPNSFNAGSELVLHSAYNLCLDLESKVLDNLAIVPQVGQLTPLVCARLLGRMLLEAPTDEGRKNVAAEIVRCNGDDVLLQELANLYKDHLLRCFYKGNGRTPASTLHPSALSFDLKKQKISALLALTPSSHKAAKAKALLRDRYRCMLSKQFDSRSVDANPSLHDGVTAVTYTHCAHIFDRSTNEDIGDPAKNAYAASVHAILDRFGGINSIEELNGSKVHRLENILTLDSNLHDSFNRLKIWLEKNTDMTQYYLLSLSNARVDFTTPDTVNLPLPDPRYLKLHAACARVASLSGAAECIDNILRKAEVTDVLAFDGGSSELLDYIFMRRLDIVAY